MNKDMRRAVALSLMFKWDHEKYQVIFKSFYDADTTPMMELARVAGNTMINEADLTARQLEALEPKVVE